jgi:hypothetical protein
LERTFNSTIKKGIGKLKANAGYYIISIASTKKVVTKGKISVSQGQCVATASTSAAVEIKNNNQYKPLLFLFTSMKKICAKIRQMLINKNIVAKII